ncbi:MAG: twin-arginine translocation pathway signal protein [Pseudomonadota bacterium]
MIKRRSLLLVGGGSVLLVGGTGVWLGTRTSRQAREPWTRAGESFGDPRLDALAYAVLAPNPHNMQPWQVRLEEGLEFSVYANPERLLPETDPPARQITIGFGAFLELFRQAAAEMGYQTEVEPFPEGEPFPLLDHRPVARVSLKPEGAVATDPLFPYAKRRRTVRAPFATESPVASELLEAVIKESVSGVHASYITDPARIADLRELTKAAWEVEWNDSAARRESVRVTRIGKAEVQKNPWGICLDGALLSALGAAGLVSRSEMDTPGSTAFTEGLNGYSRACETAMAYLWSSTADNNRRDQLKAGASWVRLQQAATREGIAFHPLSQALQEFPAMAEHYRRIHDMLAEPGHTVQMLVRVGYAKAPGPAPREPLSAKLLAV